MDYNKIIIALVIVLVVIVAAGLLFLNPGHAKSDTRVVVSSNSTLYDGDNFTVKLTDVNNTSIANQTVNVTIIDANGAKNPQVVTTDANGYGSLQLNGLTVGNYTMNVTYGGNDNYTSCNTTQKLEIKEKVIPTVTSSSSSKSSSNVNDNYIRDANGNIMYAHVDVGGDVPMTIGGHYAYNDTDEPGSPSGYWVEKI